MGPRVKVVCALLTFELYSHLHGALDRCSLVSRGTSWGSPCGIPGIHLRRVGSSQSALMHVSCGPSLAGALPGGLIAPSLAPLEKTILWEPGWRLGTRYNVVPARLQNARLFAIGTILEVDLVGAFLMNLTTVSGK